MIEMNDQSSDTSSDLNWSLDTTIDGQQHDRVVFENVADQYVKGEDVTAFFTILQDIKVNPDEDQIGLLRVGCTDVKECIAVASVQFNPSVTAGSVRHGIAAFPSSALPVTDDEFYQFCYIVQKTKNLGSSIPFQLNCALDDIDLLSNTPVRKTKPDGLIALADHQNNDFIVIHTKQKLTEDKLRQENRQLLDMNRRLESEKDQCQAKLDACEQKQKEEFEKLNDEMQSLIAQSQTTTNELKSREQLEANLRAQYGECCALRDQYQSQAKQYAEQYQTLEQTQGKSSVDLNQVRNQLAVTSQLAKEQATQIIDLERRLMQSDEISKTANQRQALLEQQIRDLRLTSEKHQLAMQAQLDEFNRQTIQRTDQIEALEMKNLLLKEELKSVNEDNECLTITSKKNQDLAQELQQKLEQLTDQHHEETAIAQHEIETLRQASGKKNTDQEAYVALKASFTEIEKRCVKHQKTEIEVKRQLNVYQNFISDLQKEIQDLTERLNAGAEEYRTLSRKYTMLENSIKQNQEKPTPTNDSLFNDEQIDAVLQNTNDHQQAPLSLDRSSFVDVDEEVRQCPMCFWEFPAHLTMDGKREHIDHHFQ